MMGSKLKLEIMTSEPTGVGAVYRYSGRMMGLTIAFILVQAVYLSRHIKHEDIAPENTKDNP